MIGWIPGLHTPTDLIPADSGEGKWILEVLINSEQLYKLPCDEVESQRLNLQHLIWTKLVGGLYPSDLSDVVGRRIESAEHPEVLDVGCGTAIWALGMCKLFPGALVTGLDLRDWNAGNGMLPPNYKFRRLDLAGGLPGDFSSRFDVIQCRAVLQHVAEPNRLVEDMARCLKPGGVLLLVDGELSQGSFDRSKKRIKPFIYDTTLTSEENLERADRNQDCSWLAGWLSAFGRGLESSEYKRPDELARASRYLTDVKLRDVWMNVSVSDNGSDWSESQDVGELISVNYVKAFDAVRSVLARQGIPDAFVRDVWQPKILEELRLREFTSLWHYISAVRVDDLALVRN